MAGTTLRVTRSTGVSAQDEIYRLRQTVNQLVDDLEAVRAALVAHGAVGHTTVDLAASVLTAPKVLSHGE